MTFPTDLLLAVLCISAISAALAYLGVRSKCAWPKNASSLAAILAVAILLLHAFWLIDNLLLARILPVADVIAWANLQTPAMAFLAGLAWSHLPGPRWQKVLLVGTLVGFGIWRLLNPYIGQSPALGPNRWTDGVCRQSTKSTCSAAAAATLLAAHNIPATEAAMAKLCLTHADGTSLLGLYRGLKLKSADTKWAVTTFFGSAADLQHQPLPAVITITVSGLPTTLFGSPTHSTVVFTFPDANHIDIGDPYAGRQRWTLKQLEDVYQGSAIALIPR